MAEREAMTREKFIERHCPTEWCGPTPMRAMRWERDLDTLLTQARRAALEEARDAQCLLCKQGLPYDEEVNMHIDDDGYLKLTDVCSSEQIHKLLTEGD